MYFGGAFLSASLTNEFQNYAYSYIKRLADRSNHSYCIVNGKFQIISFNELFQEMLGYSSEQLKEVVYIKLLEDKKSGQYLKKIQNRIEEGKLTRAHVVHRRKKRASFYAEIDCVPFLDEEGTPNFILLFVRDITHNQLQNFMARIEQELYKAIQTEKSFIEKLELVCNGVDSMFYQHSLTSVAIKERKYIHLIQSETIASNKSVVKLKRQKEIEFYDKIINQEEIIIYDYVASLPLYRNHIEYANDKNLHCCALIPIKQPDGEPIGVINIMFSEQYINDKVYFKFFEKLVDLIGLAHMYEMKQREVYQLAYFDPYIGIVNRQGFLERASELASAANGGYIQLVEAGEFSQIVELYGRETGENLLKQICDRIFKVYAVESMFIGRFSSSALILYVSAEKNAASNIEDYLEQIVKHPFSIAGKSFYVTLKSGVAKINYSKHPVTKEFFVSNLIEGEMIQQKQSDGYDYTKFKQKLEADLLDETIRFSERALSQAKRYSGTYTSFYVRRDDEDLERELEILNEIIASIEKKEFEPYLQPKIELNRGRIYGFEALARWNSEKLGFVSPGEFIPIAEKAGLIRKIDLIIFEKVLQWFQQRHYDGKKVMPVAINISPQHFYHPDFVGGLIELVQKYFADPRLVIIEVTEGIGLVDVERAIQILNRLINYGFSTSVDDFGVGYSSLSYLQKLRFTEIKIDQSFTARIDEISTLAIVKAIVMIAKNLGATTIAEGVEKEEQQRILKDLGVEVVQGYLHHKPAQLEHIEKLLDSYVFDHYKVKEPSMT